jgi:hypothetical protein
MSIGIGSYQTNDQFIDRLSYGMGNGAIAAGVVGGGTALVMSKAAAHGKTLLARPSTTQLMIAGTMAAASFAGIVSSHLCTGGDDTRLMAGAAAGGVMGALGGIAIGSRMAGGWQGKVLGGLAGAVGGAMLSTALGPITEAR